MTSLFPEKPRSYISNIDFYLPLLEYNIYNIYRLYVAKIVNSCTFYTSDYNNNRLLVFLLLSELFHYFDLYGE